MKKLLKTLLILTLLLGFVPVAGNQSPSVEPLENPIHVHSG